MIHAGAVQEKNTNVVITQINMISFVYFDVGGVAILDFSGTNKWNELKNGLKIPKEQDQAFDKFFTEYEADCTDRDIDSLIPIIKTRFGASIPKNYSMLTDFVTRFEKNPLLWPVIKKVKEKCRIGLLTDMYPRMLQAIRNYNLLPPVDWDVIIDSSVVKYQKPNKKIFEIAEKEARVNKHEILFIDNTIKNIQAALNFGWQTFLYDSTNPEESSHNLLNYFSTII